MMRYLYTFLALFLFNAATAQTITQGEFSIGLLECVLDGEESEIDTADFAQIREYLKLATPHLNSVFTPDAVAVITLDSLDELVIRKVYQFSDSTIYHFYYNFRYPLYYTEPMGEVFAEMELENYAVKKRTPTNQNYFGLSCEEVFTEGLVPEAPDNRLIVSREVLQPANRYLDQFGFFSEDFLVRGELSLPGGITMSIGLHSFSKAILHPEWLDIETEGFKPYKEYMKSFGGLGEWAVDLLHGEDQRRVEPEDRGEMVRGINSDIYRELYRQYVAEDFMNESFLEAGGNIDIPSLYDELAKFDTDLFSPPAGPTLDSLRDLGILTPLAASAIEVLTTDTSGLELREKWNILKQAVLEDHFNDKNTRSTIVAELQSYNLDITAYDSLAESFVNGEIDLSTYTYASPYLHLIPFRVANSDEDLAAIIEDFFTISLINNEEGVVFEIRNNEIYITVNDQVYERTLEEFKVEDYDKSYYSDGEYIRVYKLLTSHDFELYQKLNEFLLQLMIDTDLKNTYNLFSLPQRLTNDFFLSASPNSNRFETSNDFAFEIFPVGSQLPTGDINTSFRNGTIYDEQVILGGFFSKSYINTENYLTTKQKNEIADFWMENSESFALDTTDIREQFNHGKNRLQDNMLRYVTNFPGIKLLNFSLLDQFPYGTDPNELFYFNKLYPDLQNFYGDKLAIKELAYDKVNNTITFLFEGKQYTTSIEPDLLVATLDKLMRDKIGPGKRLYQIEKFESFGRSVQQYLYLTPREAEEITALTKLPFKRVSLEE